MTQQDKTSLLCALVSRNQADFPPNQTQKEGCLRDGWMALGESLVLCARPENQRQGNLGKPESITITATAAAATTTFALTTTETTSTTCFPGKGSLSS